MRGRRNLTFMMIPRRMSQVRRKTWWGLRLRGHRWECWHRVIGGRRIFQWMIGLGRGVGMSNSKGVMILMFAFSGSITTE